MLEITAAARHAYENDTELQREYDELHRAAIAGIMQQPGCFQELLGLDAPPTSISHPPLSQLKRYPFSEHPRLICEAVLRNMGGGCSSSGGEEGAGSAVVAVAADNSNGSCGI